MWDTREAIQFCEGLQHPENSEFLPSSERKGDMNAPGKVLKLRYDIMKCHSRIS